MKTIRNTAIGLMAFVTVAVLAVLIHRIIDYVLSFVGLNADTNTVLVFSFVVFSLLYLAELVGALITGLWKHRER